MNTRTKTIGAFRAIHDLTGDPYRPWFVQRNTPRGWQDVQTYRDGPARFADRDDAINCAWNLDHYSSICRGRVHMRPAPSPLADERLKVSI